MTSSKWIHQTLDDISLGIYDGPHATPKKIDAGPIYLSISSLENGRLDLSKSEHLSEADFDKWTKRVTPQKDDLVFSYETRLGEAALIPSGLKCCLGRRMGLIRPNPEKVHPRYLLYYYLSPVFQDLIRERTIAGSTVERILIQEVPTFPILVPPLPEQRAIARILSALDEKIELNRRMNHTLEAMAQALFKSWFVDFDPVTSKANGHAPFGMDAETAALFPSAFEETELGSIPKGWKVGKICGIADVIDCLHSKKPQRQESGRILLQLSNIKDDGLLDLTDIFYISEEDYQKWISRLEASEGDCVITNVGRVGAVSQIPPGVKAALGRNMSGIRCKPEYPYPAFLVTCLMSDAMRDEIDIKTDTGTILDALNVKNIPFLRFALAPKPVLKAFEKAARPLRAQMETNSENSHTLAKIRDALLPQLLSGEIRVPIK